MILRVVLLFALLAAAATWPQAIRMDSIPNNVDAYFSLWRLGWIAHQLPTDPLNLFHANIFYPERYTLAYSDALVLQSVFAMPFIRAGVPIVYAYNALVLGSFVASGAAMFLLVRHLTHATLPAILAGVVFAFTPYRFDHYYHLELLWPVWMPLAFLMVHRTLEGGRVRDGVAAGAFVALQILSSIYYGILLCSLLSVFTMVMVVPAPMARLRTIARPLAVGAIVAALIAVPYAVPYRHARAALGERSADEALLYAAGPRHYLAAVPDNVLLGPLTGSLGRHEKRLFPGFAALALAALALVPPVSRPTLAYLLVLLIAVNLSFGPRGVGYDWLREHVLLFRGLRAPARFGQAVLMGVAVLAGFGCARLRGWLADRRYPAAAITAVLIAVAMAEYVVRPLTLIPVPTTAPPVYRWLRNQAGAIVAELPMPTRQNSPLHEGVFEFLSTFHWRPIVNGYSGNWSPRYQSLVDRAAAFPDDAALDALRSVGVTHIVVHERYYGPDRFREIATRLRAAPHVREAGRFPEEGHEVRVFRIERFDGSPVDRF